MSIEIIEQRLQQYHPQNKQAELNAFKEIAQEITLSALSRSNFFKLGAFQGGTCLRILHHLQRFSEGLDFLLFEMTDNFSWKPFLKEIQNEFSAFDLSLEVKERSKAGNAVKKAFLKESSFGQVLKLQYERDRSDIQTATIKLEIDTRPPSGSNFENKIINFPTPFSIVSQDLASLFSGKLHALLCREYVKGRDWYDFIWYVSQETPVNYEFLASALRQTGPWEKQSITVDSKWLIESLKERVNSIDWRIAKSDIIKFIQSREAASIELWSIDFFTHFIEVFSSYC